MTTATGLRHIAVAVMAKAPILGVAKTRLGRDIGNAAATTLYQAFLLDTLDLLEESLGELTTCTVPPDCFLVCPDDGQARRLRQLVDPPWLPIAQRRSGLMGGIADAFDAGFGTGAEVVLVSDADSPAITPTHIHACIHLAATHDVALGPTRDGGYYLIGARRSAAHFLPALLLEPTYDGATIRVATLQEAERLGLTTASGPVGSDVDTVDELDELIQSLAATCPDRLRHTRLAIERLGYLGRLERPVGDAP